MPISYERRDVLRAKGWCLRCQKRKRDTWRVLCLVCRDYLKTYHIERKRR